MICRKKLIAADFSFCLGNTKRLRAMHEKDVFVERKLSHDRWWPVYIKSSQAWWRWWWRSGREVTSPLYHLNPNLRRRPACTYTLIDWFVHIYEKSLQWQHSVAFKGLTTNFNGIQRINSRKKRGAPPGMGQERWACTSWKASGLAWAQRVLRESLQVNGRQRIPIIASRLHNDVSCKGAGNLAGR